MRILFDNGAPKPIARSLTGHEITYARPIGWHELKNGDLIQKAEEAGYDVLLSHRQKYPVSAEPFRAENLAGDSRQLAMAARPVVSRSNRRRGERLYAGQLYRSGHSVQVRPTPRFSCDAGAGVGVVFPIWIHR